MVNKVILVGHVGKDPEVTRMDNNLVRARFTLATNERWIKDGNRVEHTEWHNIVMWRNLAEIAEKYVRKGSLLCIEGRINSRTYDDKDGIKRYAYDIVADEMKLLGSKPEGSSQSSAPQAAPLPPIETTDLEPDSPPDNHPF